MSCKISVSGYKREIVKDNTLMKNEELKKLYDQVYRQGKDKFFSKYVNGKDISDTDKVVLPATEWERKSVLDMGCGTGKTAYLIANAGAKQVVGIDYSEAAIEAARQEYSASNLSYQCMNLLDWKEPVDVVVSCGTLEHMDRPRDTLAMMGQLVPAGGELIITCPCFLNIRGFIWMALQTLLNVPMSLTDLHSISPFDIENWLHDTPLRLIRVQTFDYPQGNGHLMLTDLQKRLPKVLTDAKLDNTRVQAFIEWLEKVVHYREANNTGTLDGATALYLIQKQKE